MLICCEVNFASGIEPRTFLVIVVTTIIVDTLMFVPVSISICRVTDLSRLTVTVSLTSTSMSSTVTMTTDWMCGGTVVVIDTAVLTLRHVAIKAVFMGRNVTNGIEANTFTVCVVTVIYGNTPFTFVTAISCGTVLVF